MKQMFTSLEIGLGVAVVVILIMLTAYFQSFALAMTGHRVGAGGPLPAWCSRSGSPGRR